MLRILLPLVAYLFSSQLLADTAELEWQKVKDEQGVQVFLAEVPGSDIKAFRGETFVAAGLYQVLGVLDDAPGFVDWMYDCKDSVLIQRPSILERVQYLAIDFPWPTSDRDMVLLNKVKYDEEAMAVTIRMSSLPESALPVDANLPEEGRRRARDVTGEFRLQGLSENTTRVIYQLHMDPAGSIPAGIVNAKLVANPYNSLLALQKQAQLAKYQDFDPMPVIEAEAAMSSGR